jgi:DGQHR domain-containing protein
MQAGSGTNDLRTNDAGRRLETTLCDEEAGFMTPLLLNARDHVEFMEQEPGSGVGFLRVPARPTIAKIDGQHRGIGVEEHVGDPDHPVPFMMFENLDTDLEQDLFIAINHEQKKGLDESRLLRRARRG